VPSRRNTARLSLKWERFTVRSDGGLTLEGRLHNVFVSDGCFCFVETQQHCSVVYVRVCVLLCVCCYVSWEWMG